MIRIDKGKNALFQLLIRVCNNLIFKFSRFKITSRKQTDHIWQFSSAKAVHESNSQHISIIRRINIFVTVCQPLHFCCIRRGCKIGIFLHLCIKVRLHGKMTEIINHFTQHIPIVCGIWCHLRHYKIRLTQRCSLWIDSNENFCYLINFKRMIQFNHTNLSICDGFQFCKFFRNFIKVNIFITICILIFKSPLSKIWFEQNRNIRNPLFIFQMRSILYFKSFCRVGSKRIKSNPNAVLIEILV